MSVTERNTEAALLPLIRRAAKVPAILLALLYLAAVLLPLLVGLFLGKRGKESFAYEIGLSVSLVGFAMLLMQFVLASRAKWLDRSYEMDLVYQFHRVAGIAVGVLILAHPIILAAARRGWPLLIGLNQHWYIWVGRAALVVLVVLALQAVFRTRLKLDYQKWQVSHSLLSVLLLIGAFVHVWFAGGDSKLAAMKFVWALLAGAAAVAYAWRRFGLPARLRQHAYAVETVRQEAEGVWTVTLTPPPGMPLPEYLPGQYQYLTLCQAGLPAEEHPFTLSSSPTGRGSLSSTIKASGDYTRTIGQIRPGDAALVDAPYGRFSYLLYPEEEQLVFLAGGIGITPLMSMLRHLRDTGTAKKVQLLYANRTEADIVFREELTRLECENAPSLVVSHFLSRPGKEWAGESGHINAEVLCRLVPNIGNRGFYLCGPAAFISSLAGALHAMGVPASRIHYEGFGQ